MPSDLDVVASRTLELRHDDGTTSPVLVRIGRPYPDAVDYRCDYQPDRTPSAWGPRYPYGTNVGQEQACALVRFCREQGPPIV
jgi:hypothetical protein